MKVYANEESLKGMQLDKINPNTKLPVAENFIAEAEELVAAADAKARSGNGKQIRRKREKLLVAAAKKLAAYLVDMPLSLEARTEVGKSINIAFQEACLNINIPREEASAIIQPEIENALAER